MEICGLIQSTLVSVPVIWTFFPRSKTAVVEWCAHNDPAAIRAILTAVKIGRILGLKKRVSWDSGSCAGVLVSRPGVKRTGQEIARAYLPFVMCTESFSFS